jgi:hypothetical protein
LLFAEFFWQSSLNPKTEVETRRVQGARPSGRFNVHLANGSHTYQTMLTVKRRERRAPVTRFGWRGFVTSVLEFKAAGQPSMAVVANLPGVRQTIRT